VIVVVGGGMTYDASESEKQAVARRPACGGEPPAVPPELRPTTVDTVGQAMRCLFDRYSGGPALDVRELLVAAFAGFTVELDRRGADRTEATLPPLTGERERDWAAFRDAYLRVTAVLPGGPALHQALAEAAIRGMVSSVRDNHVSWVRQPPPPVGWPPEQVYGLGLVTSPHPMAVEVAPYLAAPPLHVTEAWGPAAAQGIQPGDVIVSVNGSEPFADGVASVGVIRLLAPQYPGRDPVQLVLRRPSTGRVWTVTMEPGPFRLPYSQSASSRRIGDLAYVRLKEFGRGAADTARGSVLVLHRETPVRGVIIDVRGNGGGMPEEVALMVGMFVHGKAWSHSCDHAWACTPNLTDDGMPLLGLPLVVLTDRGCASACDAFSGAVRDLDLGDLVGTRTSGLVSGPASGFVLDDGSMLLLPRQRELSAAGEIINGIGVAPDHHVPTTAEDLSAGRDPALDKAVSLLGG
ncbi:MAG TPA: S41 family peptidase, partial [Candidatus Limnocylindrales bacterium]